ncbi:TylF/MycF family methyltransferase, partial [Opitutales bacterium]|nr:TylF/MycF family methyltransferase [Opitutales bacterium]
NKRETVEKRLSLACGSPHNIKIIEGSVPKTINDEVVDSILENGEISFMHIDMNNAEPEKAALEKLYKHVAKGGFILLDDYGYNGFGFQKKAIDSMCQSIRCLPPLCLPTGQGLIIKT